MIHKSILIAVCLASSIMLGQNPQAAAYPGALATDANLLVAINNGIGTLSGALNNSATTFGVTTTATFLAPTALTIDQEILMCTTYSGNTFSVCTRGFQGTTPAAHNQGALVFENQISWFINQSNAEIKAIEAALGTNFHGGGAATKTVSYSVLATDNNQLIAMNCTSCTITLASAPFTPLWRVGILNLNSTSLTISPNGRTINGTGGSITIPQYSSVAISTDGTNYFSASGSGGGGSFTYPGAGVACSTGSAWCTSYTVGGGASNLVQYDSTANLLVGPLVSDAGYKLDVQSSGSSATVRFFDQTPTTGKTQEQFWAGAGQGSTDLAQYRNNAGQIQGGIDAVGETFVSTASTGNKTVSMSTAGMFISSNVQDVYCSSVSVDSCAADTGLYRHGVGSLEINNTTAGTYRDLFLRNLTASGLGGSGTQIVCTDNSGDLLAGGCGSSAPFGISGSGTSTLTIQSSGNYGCNGVTTVLTGSTSTFTRSSGSPSGVLNVGISCLDGHLKLITPTITITQVTCTGFIACDDVAATNFPAGVIPIGSLVLAGSTANFGTLTDLRFILSNTLVSSGVGIICTVSGSTESCAVDTTIVPQKFFGTSAPGSVPGNLPGDSFTDTTNHNQYYCGAPSGTAAPACTSVTVGGWTLNGGSAGGFVYIGVLSGIPATCSIGQVSFITDATAGQNQYNCTATNTWTQNLNSGAAGASTALSNLSAVSINTSLLSQVGVDLGSTAKPFRNAFLYGAGTFGTNSFELTGTPTGTRVLTLPDATGTLLYNGGPLGTPSSGNGSNFTNIPNGALVNSATTVNGQTCTLGSTCTLPIQTNGSPNTSQSGINHITSTVNAVGLTITPSNPGTNQEKYEIAGLLTNAGLVNSSATVNGQTCTLGSSCVVYTQMTVANSGTGGTFVNTLTTLTGAPSTAVRASISTRNGVVGITVSGAGTTGSAIIQTSGLVNCVFSNGTTAGDYVQISSTPGDCLDTGSLSFPTSNGQVIGRVLSTNASAGTYQIDLFPSEIPPSKQSSGSAGVIQGSDGAGGFQATSCTDNGTTVNCTEGITSPSVSSGSAPPASSVCGPNGTSPSGFLCLAEGNTPIGTGTSVDTIWASTGHRVNMLMNGSNDVIIGLATSDTLTNKLLATIGTGTNCSSAASPAVCGTSAAGSIAIPTGVTTVTLVVDTSAVTANSQIFLFADDTLGTRLSVTCNSTLATLTGGMAVTARTPGTSFTITYNGTIATNPLCANFVVVN